MFNRVFFSFLAVCILLFSCLMMGGCGSPGSSAPYALVNQPMQLGNRIVILDNNVLDTLFLVNTSQARLPGGQIQVKATFQNRFQNQDIWVDVGFEFQDKNGMLVDRAEWVATRFPAAEVTLVQGTSISPLAQKHVLLLKNLRTAQGGPLRDGNGVFVVQ